MIKKTYFLLAILFSAQLFCQQRVYSLVPGISVDSILFTKPGASKLAKDPVSGNIFYATANGDVYEVFISANSTDSLRYTAAQHGITSLQGLCFLDSTMYLCGNQWGAVSGVGMVVKGKLTTPNTRVWTNIALTDPYPMANMWGDHGFSGINIDPQKKFLYVSSGARTHLGEIRTLSGAWPGKREVPLTTCILKFPIDTVGVTLPNDSTLLSNTGLIFARGTRNAYDMAWDAGGNLFAIDNSGERDDPEELNWLRSGKNYGYPWRMGGNYNPLMNWPYNPSNDPLVNPQSGGFQSGWFSNDSTFPSIPSGVTFTEPVLNYGPDADFYRDSVTGQVKNASDEGTFITSFTAHRTPLGLVIDKDSLLPSFFKGDALMLSFMPGGDSTGFSSLSPWGSPCPFVDPVRDLLHIKLSYNSGLDNYTMTCTKVMFGFYLPVDAELIRDTLYVLENGGNIWRIIFTPAVNVQNAEMKKSFFVYPNPATSEITVSLGGIRASEIKITDLFGNLIHKENVNSGMKTEIDISDIKNGIYFLHIQTPEGTLTKKIIVQR